MRDSIHIDGGQYGIALDVSRMAGGENLFVVNLIPMVDGHYDDTRQGIVYHKTVDEIRAMLPKEKP